MRSAAWVAVVLSLAGCSNNPYSDADAHRKIAYSSFREPPRTLDPAVAYTTNAHVVTGAVYDTLLEYHYLKRPYTLIPGLARQLPTSRVDAEGRMAYRFELREGLLYQDDPCFAAAGGAADGRRTREVVAADIAFELMRIGDPSVNSPVIDPFANVLGFREFTGRLQSLRAEEPGFADRPAHEQYAAAGGIEGVRVDGRYGLEIVLAERYPQILYWFAMPFTTPLPWEAVDYYDGEGDRPPLADHPVGSGAYVLSEYDKDARMVLERNPNWYGIRHPEWHAPGAVYPSEGEEEDRLAGRLDPAVVGRPLPFIERVEYLREKEEIPYFTKFLQGYYDASGVIKESFDKVIADGGLSAEMRALGIQLEKSVEPTVTYLGFNMDDPVLGHPAGDRGRKLRQAMSLVIDTEEFTRIFQNGRGVPAQTPLPPGLFGYDPDYVNPYRTVDLARARSLMEQAGYPGGIDPSSGKPLRLTFDTSDTSAAGRLMYEFFTDAWGRLGLDVEIAATNYNQFQEKVRNGAYQLFMWGWVADYPDPENFLFLLWSEMARSNNGGPNTANFKNERFDELYLSMKARENGPERMGEIREMISILERERPWIELMYRESYALFHGWFLNVKSTGMSYPTMKYKDIDAEKRAALRAEWNRPVLWPVYTLAALFVVVLAPGVVTFIRERQ